MSKSMKGSIRFLNAVCALLKVVVLLVFFLAGPLMAQYRPYRSGDDRVGTAFRIEDEAVPVIGELTSILADQDRLYLIWENAMVVRVYDLDGAYLYSWWIPYENRNDAIISVWAQGGEMYINTRANMLYHMVNDMFVDAQESHVGTEGLTFTRSELPAWPVDGRSITVEDISFELRGVDVYRIEGDVASKVVDRPDVLVLMSWKALWLIGLGCIVILAGLQYVSCRLRKC